MENIKSYDELNESFEEMTERKVKEIFLFLDKNGEHALVAKYKNKLSDDDLSNILQYWATSNYDIDQISKDYWKQHSFWNSKKNGLSDIKTVEKIIKELYGFSNKSIHYEDLINVINKGKLYLGSTKSPTDRMTGLVKLLKDNGWSVEN